MKRWDAVVVGAGPAGALAARQLAASGMGVLLVERRRFPREKVCGGCLNAHGVQSLRRAGLGGLVDATRFPHLRGLDLRARGRVGRFELDGGRFVERSAFDAALAEAAIAEGALFRDGVVARSDELVAGARVLRLASTAGEERVEASLVVAADGLGGATLGLPSRVVRDSRLGAGACLSEQHADLEPGRIEMSVGAEGYVGLVRDADGRLHAAAALDPAAARAEGGPAGAARRIREEAGAEPLGLDGLWSGTPALTRRPERPAAERLLAIGDASGYVEPFTGEGMAWALADALAVAELAGAAVRGWHPGIARDWSRRHRRRTRRARLRCRSIALLLRRPRLLAALLAGRERGPAWAAAAIASIHGRAAR